MSKLINSIKLEKGNNKKIPNMICGYFDDLNKTLKEIYRIINPKVNVLLLEDEGAEL